MKYGTSLSAAHLRSVGMGGRREGSAYALNDVKWLATACPSCARDTDESPDRESLRQALKDYLQEKYGYDYSEA